MRLLHVLLGAAAHVVQFGSRTQGLIPGFRQLLLERLHALRQIVAGSGFGRARRLGFGILRIKLVFVSHGCLLENNGRAQRPSIQPPIWGRRRELQGGGLPEGKNTLYK
ncbi:hypothetical protein D9M71_636820 [compost metagenome]